MAADLASAFGIDLSKYPLSGAAQPSSSDVPTMTVRPSGPRPSSGIATAFGIDLSKYPAVVDPDATPPIPLGKMTGWSPVIGAAIKSGVIGGISALTDPIAGLLAGPIDQGPGKPYAHATPVGDFLRNLGGDPAQVVPSTQAQAVAGPIIEAAAGTLPLGVGELGQSAVRSLGSIARNAISGASAGAASEAAESVAPDWAKPYVGLVAGTVGGVLPEAAAAGANKYIARPAIKQLGEMGVSVPAIIGGPGKQDIMTAPNTPARDSNGNPLRVTQSQINKAVGKVTTAAEQGLPAGQGSALFQRAIEQPGSPVPGVERTLAQQAPVPGIVGLDTTYRTAYPADFTARTQQQGTALTRDVQSVASPTANPQSVGRMFTSQLDALEAAREAETGAARREVFGRAETAGGVGTPEGYGQTIAGGVEATQKPLREAAAQNIAEAEASRDAALAATPTGRTATPDGATVPEQYGAEARGAVMTARQAAVENEQRVWDAINPNGDAGAYSAPFKARVTESYREVPKSAVQPSGEEAAILKIIGQWPELVPLTEIQAMRTRIGDAITREIESAGKTPTVISRRLIGARNALDSALEETLDATAEQQAAEVAAGRRAPDSTVAGRIQEAQNAGQPNDVGRVPGAPGETADLGTQTAGAGRTGNGAGENTGARPSVGGGERGTGGESGQPSANAASGRGVAASAATGLTPLRESNRAPETLRDFIISRGGMQDRSGEYKARDLLGIHHQAGGRLINPRGAPEDRMREAALEAGFPVGQDLTSFREAVTSHNPVYRGEEAALAQQRVRDRAVAQQNADARYDARDAISVAADEAGVRLTPAQMDHATDLRLHGIHPDEAIRQASEQAADVALQRNAEREAIGSPGVHPAARQAELPVGTPEHAGIPSATRPLTREELTASRAANLVSKERAQTFDNGVIGDILEPGEYQTAAQVPENVTRARGGFSTQDAEVLGKLWNAKTTEAANLRAAQKAGISPEMLKNWASDDLRAAAVDPNTKEFDLKAYAKWRRDHAAGLHIFPEVKDAFDGAARAQETLTTRRAEAGAVEAANPLAKTKYLSEVPGRYMAAGDTGADMVRQFRRDTGGAHDAAEALNDYVIYRMRNEPGLVKEDGTIDPKALARFRTRYGSMLSELRDVSTKLGSLADAQTALDTVMAEHKAQIDAFQNGVAKYFLNDDPHTAVRKAFGSGNPERTFRELTDAVKGNPDAVEGMKKAVVDYITDQMSSVRPADENIDFLKAGKFREWVTHNKGALRIIFGGQGMQNLERVVAELRRQAFAAQAVSGSDTTQKIIGAEKAGVLKTHHSGNILAAFLGEHAGLALGAFPLVGPLAALGVAKLYHVFKQAGINTTNDLVKTMLLHVPVTQELMAKVAAKSEVGNLARRRVGAAIQAAVLSDLSQSRQEQAHEP